MQHMRTVRLLIAPATATTCGDGTGNFCRFVRTSHFGTVFTCALAEPGQDGLRDEGGWLTRTKECLSAEVQT